MQFSVKTERITASIDSYQRMRQKIERCNQSLQRIQSNMSGYSYGNAQRLIRDIIKENERYIQGLQQMEAALGFIAQRYEETENKLLNIQINGQELTVGGENAAPDVDGEESAWDYILSGLEQAVLGDFSDESNLLGITLSVILGFVPVVGQICDIRDLIADVYLLFDDGPETSEWVDLGFSVAAVIPGVGDFLKHANHASDALGDTTKGVIKKSDEVVSAIRRYADNFNNFMDQRVFSKITDGINHAIDAVPHGKVVRKVVTELMDQKIDFLNTSTGEFIKEWVKEWSEDKVKGWISNGIDGISDYIRQETGAVLRIGRDFACVA